MKAINIKQPYVKKFDYPLLNQKKELSFIFNTGLHCYQYLKKKKRQVFNAIYYSRGSLF